MAAAASFVSTGAMMASGTGTTIGSAVGGVPTFLPRVAQVSPENFDPWTLGYFILSPWVGKFLPTLPIAPNRNLVQKCARFLFYAKLKLVVEKYASDHACLPVGRVSHFRIQYPYNPEYFRSSMEKIENL
ncbi:MAG: hypothetical protein Q7U36_00900 [bacterium]|nr:hypothetical protein [bacterium]